MKPPTRRTPGFRDSPLSIAFIYRRLDVETRRDRDAEHIGTPAVEGDRGFKGGIAANLWAFEARDMLNPNAIEATLNIGEISSLPVTSHSVRRASIGSMLEARRAGR
jgi:hypothetical protein